MPNTNPSGPNQPLNQHPLPFFAPTLGADLVALDELAAGTHQLLEATPSGVSRMVSGGNAMLTISAGTAPIADVVVFIKDEDGLERVLFSAAAILAGAFSVASLIAEMITNNDQGLFLRFTGGDGTTSVVASLEDVRGISVQDTEVTGTTPVALTPVTPAGNVQKIAKMPAVVGIGAPALLAYNFGPAVNIILDIFDGTTAIDLGAAVPVLAAIALGVTSGPAGYPNAGQTFVLPPGWVLRARLDAAAPAGQPVIVRAGIVKTNQSPVRQDQGGAY